MSPASRWMRPHSHTRAHKFRVRFEVRSFAATPAHVISGSSRCVFSLEEFGVKDPVQSTWIAGLPAPARRRRCRLFGRDVPIFAARSARAIVRSRMFNAHSCSRFQDVRRRFRAAALCRSGTQPHRAPIALLRRHPARNRHKPSLTLRTLSFPSKFGPRPTAWSPCSAAAMCPCLLYSQLQHRLPDAPLDPESTSPRLLPWTSGSLCDRLLALSSDGRASFAKLFPSV